MSMAVDLGLHYSVEVKSRFQLFLENENQIETCDRSKIEQRDDRKLTTEVQQIRNIKQPSVNASRLRGSPVKPAAFNTDSRLVSGDKVIDHLKDEHRGQRHRGHVPPHHGREFDRKSGSDKTGIKSVPKKDGYGKGNWGTVEDEIEATMTEKNEDLNSSKENVTDHIHELTEHPTLTLEEYKAMKRYVAAQDCGRSANDGKDVFKDMKLIQSNKPAAEMETPKFASVYHTPNDSGIALTISHRSGPFLRGSFRGRGGDKGRKGRDARDGSPRDSRDDETARGGGNNRLTRGGARGAGVVFGRGNPRGGRPVFRGARGGTNVLGEPRDKRVFNEMDFPALS